MNKFALTTVAAMPRASGFAQALEPEVGGQSSEIADYLAHCEATQGLRPALEPETQAANERAGGTVFGSTVRIELWNQTADQVVAAVRRATDRALGRK